MSTVLFKRSFKTSASLLVIFIAILTLYASVMITMFDPEMGEGLEMIMQTMPEIFEALNMTGTGGTLVEFLSNYLYSFLFIVFPLVYIAILSINLVAKYTDTGSMAQILAMPVSRAKVIVTQAFALISGVLLIVLYVTCFLAVMAHMTFPNELEISKFLLLNIGLFGMLLFFAGLCFCASCIFDDTKNAAIFGAGPCVLFVLINMAANAADDFKWLHFLTPISLFNQENILSGNVSAYVGIISLYLLASALFVTGSIIFCKRNIHI